MKLSIVIVNYNVKYFLEQCLHSVRKAIEGLEAEVLIVDNNSVDGSVEMLHEKFPEFNTLANDENLGFSKANNLAIKQSKGEFILLLNPDTVVEDDTFRKIIDFMDSHPDAGGLGVKMVDGKGVFLPESKRGLPTPWVAFYKIFGLSRLFPKSKVFGKYHLGYLDKNQTSEVEILSGAFMLLRKTVLDTIGYLDETFFMYGEDIDLSYRIIKAGYKNYYFPETRIIHYKGESTKKSSINYVLVFYNAMIIFARKHFSTQNARSLSFLINLAIYFRAFLAILNRFFSRTLVPILDTILLAAGIIAIKNYWETNIIFPEGGAYPIELVSIALPLYVFTWLFSVYMSGGYDRPIQLYKILQGLVIGTIIILIGYALLPENFRFSRAIIVFGAVWGLIAMVGLRIVLHLMRFKKYQLGVKINKRYLIAGNHDEASRVADLLRKADLNPGLIGLVSVKDPETKIDGFIGSLDQIKDIINIYNIDEVIFCARDIPAQKIIDIMSEMNVSQLDFKIAPPESLSIIGSQSINTSGDAYIIELDSISKVNNRRSKRFLDILVSLFLLATFPIGLFFVKNPLGFLRNIIQVIFASKTWVGYRKTKTATDHKLPKLKKGVLNPSDVLKNKSIGTETMDRLNLLYARDYKIVNDLNVLLVGFRNLGRS
ncbi:MAG: glycosyltransferase family 2 protein [Bacteroidetes bacterium]|nr:glycosyltransferase family 2 protein [Bacteroidota bacterium]